MIMSQSGGGRGGREREGTMLSYTKCGHLSPDESTVAHLHGFVINKYFRSYKGLIRE